MDKLEYKIDRNGIVGVQLKYLSKRNYNVISDSQPFCVVSAILPLGNESNILEPCYFIDSTFQRVSAISNIHGYLYYIFNEIFGLYKAVIYYNRSGIVMKCDILQADATSLRVVPKSERSGIIECGNWSFINSDLAPYIRSQVIQCSDSIIFKEEFT